MKYATDFHLARGLGSAKSGVHHWIVQRLTAIFLIPLSIWFVIAFIALLAAPYEEVREWLLSPWSATLSVSFIFFIFYHGYLGIRAILEDYIPQIFLRWVLIIGVKIFSILMALLGVISVIKVFLS